MSAAARFIVGIDLGTTHTVVAYAEIERGRAAKRAPAARIFDISQRVSANAREALPLLPSCLYAPLEHEREAHRALEQDAPWLVGAFARTRSAEVRGRSIQSAKSWLSHGSVDRLAPILPWENALSGAPDHSGVTKISPVEASRLILALVRDAWNMQVPDAPLEAQDVVLTVPASFDDVARALTFKAANDAGLSVTLLEEPTAAFYAVMRNESCFRDLFDAEKQDRERERTVLVVDVGGGTTDLALMGVRRSSRAPWFSAQRLAVGPHLLLGGDNMDVALAHHVETPLAIENSAIDALDPTEFGRLVLACREAKERLFDDPKLDETRVTVLGRGSQLLGASRVAVLRRADLERIVVNGFFPLVTENAPETPAKRAQALVAFGLPYERDPVIPRHIVRFLDRHADALHHARPDAVLLNGGVFFASALADAVIAQITQIRGDAAPVVLRNTEPDLAVARGAVAFGFARRGQGVRIEGGTARGYYVALGGAEGEPSSSGKRASPQKRAVCIIPRGAREGVKYALPNAFELTLGKPVRFEILASDVARDEAGAIVHVDAPDTPDAPNTTAHAVFERLPPVVTRFESTSLSKGAESIHVRLGGELLATGQIELACTTIASKVSDSRPEQTFVLAFESREHGVIAADGAARDSGAANANAKPLAPGASKARGETARVLEHVFGKKNEATAREVKDVVRDLERALGARATWTLEVARHVVDVLLTNPGARRRSPEHERAFWLLLGFGMRPGFGDLLDAPRIERIWPLFEGRLAFPDDARAWLAFFVAWRRIAGGLEEPEQTRVRDAFDAIVAPLSAKLKKPKRVPDESAHDELRALLANLERVSAPRRSELGEWLIEKTWTSRDAHLWASIGRIGARVPAYASVVYVLPTEVVTPWLTRLLREDWSRIPSAPQTAMQLARVTGDRMRDVPEPLRVEVAARLERAKANERWIRAVREYLEPSDEERAAAWGEDLPLGLRLVPE